ncbi:hypothetical protein MA03_04445 [Infirmifilum uzonense]|uniref:BPL/LPL catalytic domain-containing protein n=1 Tax=Infirmifilum uzonense TaxID=1550241 RepID=A0A0F7FHB7_9CREN|nr:hypothetical protein MA03_04445 [Infirmifilum uzonense]
MNKGRDAMLNNLERSLPELLVNVWPGLKMFLFQRCEESSQELAKGLFNSSQPVLVVCREITSARGRLGRPWHAPNGGLWFSLAFKHGTANLGILSLAAGASVARAIQSVTGLRALVKWPNDILLDDRKVGGILLEAETLDSGFLVILGIGVNVNNEVPHDLISRAVSLKEYLARWVDPDKLLVEILSELYRAISLISDGEGARVLDEWRSLSATLGRDVRVEIEEGVEIVGKALDINEEGALLVESDGKLHVFYAGDVEHLRHL